MANECKTSDEYALHYRSSTMISIGSFKSANVLCDAKVIVSGQEIPVHKLVLASRSQYFQGLFLPKSNTLDARIELNDLDPKAVKQCIDFIYNGSVTVSQTTVEELLKASCMLKLEELCKWTFAFLQSRIDGKTCLNTKRLAKIYDNPKLEEIADDYAVTHYKDISTTEDFKKLDLEYVTNVVTSHDVQLLSPAVIYESLVSWVKHDPKSREEYFPQLLAYVKLHKLSPEYLKETVQKEDLVKESKVCLEMLVNVLFGQISHSPSSSPSSSLKSTSVQQKSPNSVKTQQITKQNAAPSNALIIFDENVDAIRAYKPSTQQWLQMQSLPKDIGTFSAVVLDKFIYLLARSNQSLYRIEYASKAATWVQVTGRIVNDSCLLQLVVTDGYIFIIGDVSATRRNSNQSGVIRYGPAVNSWEHLASLKTPRRGHSVAAANGSLYCIGGSNGRQDLSSVEKLDPTVGSWALVAPLHHVRYESASVAFNRKIYVMGGGKFMDFAGGKSLRTDGEFYDPFSNQWTVLSNIKFPRHIRSACTVDSCIAVVANEESVPATGKGGQQSLLLIDVRSGQVSAIAKSLKIKPCCISICAR